MPLGAGVEWKHVNQVELTEKDGGPITYDEAIRRIDERRAGIPSAARREQHRHRAGERRRGEGDELLQGHERRPA